MGMGGAGRRAIRASALSSQSGRLIGAPVSSRCRQGRGSSAAIGQGARTIDRRRAQKRVGVRTAQRA